MSSKRIIDLTVENSALGLSSESTKTKCGKDSFHNVLMLVDDYKGADIPLSEQCPYPRPTLDLQTGAVIARMVPCKRLSCSKETCRQARIDEKAVLYKWAFKQKETLWFGILTPEEFKQQKDRWRKRDVEVDAVAWKGPRGNLAVFSDTALEFGEPKPVSPKDAKALLNTVLENLPAKSKPSYCGNWSQKGIKEARKSDKKEKMQTRYMALRMNNSISWAAGLLIMEACGVQVTNRRTPTHDDEVIGHFKYFQDEQAVANLKSCLKRGMMPSYGLAAA